MNTPNVFRKSNIMMILSVVLCLIAPPGVLKAAEPAHVTTIRKATTKPAGNEHILHFPKDRSLGSLYVRDAGIKRQIEDFYFWIDGTESRWMLAGEARGEVAIPTGKQVRLLVSKQACTDLSPLAKLGPDDLYELCLAYTPADDPCMSHVGCLTGLRVLDLRSSNIGSSGMQHVRGMKSLEQLYLPNRLTDSGMIHVGQLRTLKGLYFGSNRVTDAGLAQLANLTALEELSLGGKTQDAQGKPLASLMTNAGLAHLAKLPRLWYLNLWGDYTDGALPHLKNIPSLRTLNLSRLKITDKGLAGLAGCTRLEVLSLYGTPITDRGLIHLKPLRSLKKLDLNKPSDGFDYKNPPITNAGMADLKELKTLEHLALPYAGISDAGLADLSELSQLKYLWVGTSGLSGISDAGLKHLARLQRLEELYIGGENFGVDGLTALAGLPKLLLLNISANIAANSFVCLTKLKTLESLDINTQRKSIPLSDVNRLSGMHGLRSVHISTVVRDGTALNLTDLPQLEALRLVLAKNEQFGDEDLACAVNMKKLTRLSISRVGGGYGDVTDAGIAGLAGLTLLNHLAIGGPKVTDQGLAHIARLRMLKELTISGNFTDTGLRQLKELTDLSRLAIYTGKSLDSDALDAIKKELSRVPSMNIQADSAVTSGSPSGHPKSGEPAPDFTVTTLDKKKFTLSEHRGKVVLLHFWATWCRPCIADLPNLKKAQDRYKKKYGDRLVWVNLAMDDTDIKVRSLIDKYQWFGRHVCIGIDSKLAASYGVTSAPDDFLIGPDGRILLNRESPEGPGDTERVIDKALEGS